MRQLFNPLLAKQTYIDMILVCISKRFGLRRHQINASWIRCLPFTHLSFGLFSGGAFCTPPSWLQWGKFVSYFTYGMNALISLEFTNADPIKCGQNSIIPLCMTSSNTTYNETDTHFPAEIVLAFQDITWSALDYVIILLGIFAVSRIVWYTMLRFK